MDQEKVNAFNLVIEVSLLVFALCMSIAVGLLVEAWAGFMTFGCFVGAFVIVLAVSYARDQRKQEDGR